MPQATTRQPPTPCWPYFRNRTSGPLPGVETDAPTSPPDEQRWADEALEHRFFVHAGYQPSYFYGDDIDWQYWPVRDNELRWQLHRMKWWAPMGKAYRRSGDERYAAEWCAEYLDWIRKNPSPSMTKAASATGPRPTTSASPGDPSK